MRVKIRNTQASESTSPINADYGMSVSDSSISQKPQKSTKTSKKVSTNSGERMALPDGIDLDSVDKEVYNQTNANTKENKQYEGTAETRREFIKRKNNGIYKTIEIRGGAYSYRPISPNDISERAKETHRELQKLGIKVNICEDLEYNRNRNI